MCYENWAMATTSSGQIGFLSLFQLRSTTDDILRPSFLCFPPSSWLLGTRRLVNEGQKGIRRKICNANMGKKSWIERQRDENLIQMVDSKKQAINVEGSLVFMNDVNIADQMSGN